MVFARRLLVLFLVLVVGDRLMALACRHALLQSGIRFARLYAGPDADVLVIGDSRAVNAFYAPEMSKVLAAPVLNLGYNGVSTEFAEAMLRDYLAHHTPPRLVILEASSTVIPDSATDAMRSFWWTGGAVAALARKTHPREYLLTQVVAMYGLNGEASLRGLYYLNRSDQDWVNRYRITPQVLEAARTHFEFELTPRAKNLDALRRIAEMLRQKGVTLRVVLTPYLPIYAQKIQRRPEFVQKLSQASGVEVHDYAAALDEIDFFADRLHLNDRGAVAFVHRYARDGHLALPPRRAD